MKPHALAVALTAGLCSSYAAMAQPAPATPPVISYADIQPTTVENAPNGDDTIVCNYQHETGSLMISRVCRTLRAWKVMQKEAREFMGFAFRGAHQCDAANCGSSGGG